jgi:hypothetical protein
MISVISDWVLKMVRAMGRLAVCVELMVCLLRSVALMSRRLVAS